MKIEVKQPAPNVIRDADAFKQLRDGLKSDAIPLGASVELTLTDDEYRALKMDGTRQDPMIELETEVRRLIKRYGRDRHGQDRYEVLPVGELTVTVICIAE